MFVTEGSGGVRKEAFVACIKEKFQNFLNVFMGTTYERKRFLDKPEIDKF
jgi:hypothetical protein